MPRQLFQSLLALCVFGLLLVQVYSVQNLAHKPAVVDADDQFYVSIGDSYAAGFQPIPEGRSETTRDGFPYQIEDRVTSAGGHLRLLNFACSGATSQDVLARRGCAASSLGPDAPSYPSNTQADAALEALRQHRGGVRLVTVVVGGNDFRSCIPPAVPPTRLNENCISQGMDILRPNLQDLVIRIREVVGPEVPIVGLTYLNPFVAYYLTNSASDWSFADQTVAFFRDSLNPLLRETFASVGGQFVDVTLATRGYGTSDPDVATQDRAQKMRAAQTACRLTWYCNRADIHPTHAGHAVIADEVMRRAGLD